jgi:polyisoprenyl-phosphate glycosyltransferase
MSLVLSVVVPVYDEHENLQLLRERLLPVLGGLVGEQFEVLFVDDGSRDGSAEILDSFYKHDTRLKVLHFSRNFGHQAALEAGLERASGAAVVMMDADLQDPPEVIPALFARWRDGYEVVYAVRRKRTEGILLRAAYKVFYRTLRVISEIDFPLDAGDFCLLDQRVVKTLISLPERNRFLRGLRSWVGFTQVGVEYERAPRAAGTPKYTVSKLFRLAFTGYVGFSIMPLRAAAWLGIVVATFGFALAVWVIVSHVLDTPSPRGWASLVAVILFVAGIQLMVLGVIGEYLGRTYEEVRRRPLYIVRSAVGVDEGPELRSKATRER